MSLDSNIAKIAITYRDGSVFDLDVSTMSEEQLSKSLIYALRSGVVRSIRVIRKEVLMQDRVTFRTEFTTAMGDKTVTIQRARMGDHIAEIVSIEPNNDHIIRICKGDLKTKPLIRDSFYHPEPETVREIAAGLLISIAENHPLPIPFGDDL